MVNVGYYDLRAGQGVESQVSPIQRAGLNPVSIEDFNAASLSGIDVLFVQNPSNSNYGDEYSASVDLINRAVADGLILIFHDRFVDEAETILPAGGTFDIRRELEQSDDIEVLRDGQDFSVGPAGTITDESLDGGFWSYHGYTLRDTLPGDGSVFLTSENPNEVVTMGYTIGSGVVFYSTIPLDFYLSESSPLAQNMQDYATNLLAFASQFADMDPDPQPDPQPDPGPRPGSSIYGFSTTSRSLFEGDTGLISFTFTVSRSGDIENPGAVSYRVDGFGADDAVASDFAPGFPLEGAVFFSPGQASRSLTVRVAGDGRIEQDERFQVTLTDAANGQIGASSRALGTIRNDDQVGSVPIRSVNRMGTNGDDVLNGTSGQDVFRAFGGSDNLRGGAENDVYLFDTRLDQAFISDTGGVLDAIVFESSDFNSSNTTFRAVQVPGVDDLLIDTPFGSIRVDQHFGSGTQIERLVFANGSAIDLTAPLTFTGAANNGFQQTLSGTNGDDRFNGRGGSDFFQGFGGDDTYIFESGFGFGGIVDTSGLDDIIFFNTGSITPNDIRLQVEQVPGADNLIILVEDEGIIRIDDQITNANFRPVDRIVFSDGQEIDLGSTLILTGNANNGSVESLVGTLGDDILVGQGGLDRIFGQDGNDVYLIGSSFNDIFIAEDGGFNDVIRIEDPMVTRSDVSLRTLTVPGPDDLEITFASSTIVIDQHFATGTRRKVERIELANGDEIDLINPSLNAAVDQASSDEQSLVDALNDRADQFAFSNTSASFQTMTLSPTTVTPAATEPVLAEMQATINSFSSGAVREVLDEYVTRDDQGQIFTVDDLIAEFA